MDPLLKLYKLALDILFPLACIDCNKHIENDEFGPICKRCLNDIVISTIPSTDGIKINAVGSYNDRALAELIHALKYRGVLSVKRSLEFLIDKYLEKNHLGLSLRSSTDAVSLPDGCSNEAISSSRLPRLFLQPSNDSFSNTIIIPIPLHSRRERDRGFNQSEIIANLLAQKIGAQVNKNILKRIKYTKPQIDCKNYEERTKNIKDCFKVIDPERISNKNIIIVDDVYTSGGTIKEAVKILKRSGGKNIETFVIAKT